jgi:hypothetical protein
MSDKTSGNDRRNQARTGIIKTPTKRFACTSIRSQQKWLAAILKASPYLRHTSEMHASCVTLHKN